MKGFRSKDGQDRNFELFRNLGSFIGCSDSVFATGAVVIVRKVIDANAPKYCYSLGCRFNKREKVPLINVRPFSDLNVIGNAAGSSC